MPRTLARLLVLLPFFLACSQTLLGQAPRIDSIDPAQGPIAGGTVVTITGANFQSATLSVDKVAVTPQAISATTIKFTSATHDNGIASIKVATTAGAAYGEFLYVPPRLQDLPPGYITTVAGIGQFTGFYRPATQAEIQPQGSPVFDRQGNLYIPEPSNNRVSRVRPDGIIEPFAGTGFPSYQSGTGLGDGGPATEAAMTFPRGVTTDANGDVYITEVMHRIRRVDAGTGIITTIAGDGTAGFSGDGGRAVQARLNDASHITGDGNGTLFFIDFDDASGTARIRKITSDGTISTIAGVDPPGFSGDGGPATQAQFNLIMGDNGSLALDPQGNLFIVDTGNNRIRRIDGRSGIITTVYGPASPKSVATDAVGNIYSGDNSHTVKLSPSGQMLATYGKGGAGFSEDGTAIAAAFVDGSGGLAVDRDGNIIYADFGPHRIRRLNLQTGLLETLAGMGPRIIGENGPAIATTLQTSNNGDLAFLPSGELLVGDSFRVMVRKIDAQGNISTVGKGGNPSFPEGKGWQDITCLPGVKTTAAGEIYVADTRNVYRIDTTATVHAIAGRPAAYGYGYSGDGGPATDALLCQPWDIALDRVGNLFIADTNNNRIRRVDAQTGIITTVAGSGPVNGFEHYGQDGHGSFCGDGGPALQACLNTPYGVAVDSAGNLFIADGGNNRIRKVGTNGIITSFVDHTGATVTKLAFDGAGNLYSVTGQGLFRYDPEGRSTQIAGLWPPDFSGDGGPALQAKIRTTAQATGIAVDAEGNIFFIDNGNLRVRAVRYGALLARPTITRQPASSRVTAGQKAILAVAATGFPAPSYQWKKSGVDIPGATDAAYAITSTQYSDAGSYTVVITNMMGSITSDAAGLTVVTAPPPPSIPASPSSQTGQVGSKAEFAVIANGIAPLTYQWQVSTNGGSSWRDLSDGGNYVGTSTVTLTVNGTVAGMNGYQYRCVTTNAVGSATSNAATLTVNKATGR
jgi:sugar lactone lactonase YvrE